MFERVWGEVQLLLGGGTKVPMISCEHKIYCPNVSRALYRERPQKHTSVLLKIHRPTPAHLLAKPRLLTNRLHKSSPNTTTNRLTNPLLRYYSQAPDWSFAALLAKSRSPPYAPGTLPGAILDADGNFVGGLDPALQKLEELEQEELERQKDPAVIEQAEKKLVADSWWDADF